MFRIRGVTIVAIAVFAGGMAASSPAVAQPDVCPPPEPFVLPIITAGMGEALIATLPGPLPAPAKEIGLRFAQIARGILDVRSDVLWGRDQAARARQDQLLKMVLLNGASIERLAAIPEPIPKPPAAVLAELMQINDDLMSQVADLPGPLP